MYDLFAVPLQAFKPPGRGETAVFCNELMGGGVDATVA